MQLKTGRGMVEPLAVEVRMNNELGDVVMYYLIGDQQGRNEVMALIQQAVALSDQYERSTKAKYPIFLVAFAEGSYVSIPYKFNNRNQTVAA